jgi:hypothetical protein
MPRLADSFSACPNSKEGIDLQCFRNSRNSLAQGQMFNKFSREATLIVVSTAGVRITSSETVFSHKKPLQGQKSNQNNQGKGKKRVMQVWQGRVNFTTLVELPEGAPIMTGTFSINYKPVIILFDSGATHSFMSHPIYKEHKSSNHICARIK